MSESLTGLEQHEGAQIMTEFKFLGELSLEVIFNHLISKEW